MIYTDYSDSLRIGTFVSLYGTYPRSRKLGFGIVHGESVGEYKEIKVIDIKGDNCSELFRKAKKDDGIMKGLYILPNTYAEDIPRIYEYQKGENSK